MAPHPGHLEANSHRCLRVPGSHHRQQWGWEVELGTEHCEQGERGSQCHFSHSQLRREFNFHGIEYSMETLKRMAGVGDDYNAWLLIFHSYHTDNGRGRPRKFGGGTVDM